MKQIKNPLQNYIDPQTVVRQLTNISTDVESMIAFKQPGYKNRVFILSTNKQGERAYQAKFQTLNNRYWETFSAKEFPTEAEAIANTIDCALKHGIELFTFDTLEEFYNWAK